jgi:dihydrofolate reductase
MNIIFACDEKYGIGIDNDLPKWNVPDDLKRFRTHTIGNGNNVVIMGKNTYLSLPNNYLKRRENIVVSNSLYEEYKNTEKDLDGIKFCKKDKTIIINNLDDAYKYAVMYITKFTPKGEIWVIGGSQIYEQVIEKNLFIGIYATYVSSNYECDTFLGPKTIEKMKSIKWNDVDTFYSYFDDTYTLYEYKQN